MRYADGFEESDSIEFPCNNDQIFAAEARDGLTGSKLILHAEQQLFLYG